MLSKRLLVVLLLLNPFILLLGSAAQKESFRVVTWNVLGANVDDATSFGFEKGGKGYQRISNNVIYAVSKGDAVSQGPDILAFQEWDSATEDKLTPNAKKAIMDKYQSVSYQPKGANGGVQLYVKKDKFDVGGFQQAIALSEGGACAFALVQDKVTRKFLLIINVHLSRTNYSGGKASGEKQLDEIANVAREVVNEKPECAILMVGDFNTFYKEVAANDGTVSYISKVLGKPCDMYHHGSWTANSLRDGKYEFSSIDHVVYFGLKLNGDQSFVGNAKYKDDRVESATTKQDFQGAPPIHTKYSSDHLPIFLTFDFLPQSQQDQTGGVGKSLSKAQQGQQQLEQSQAGGGAATASPDRQITQLYPQQQVVVADQFQQQRPQQDAGAGAWASSADPSLHNLAFDALRLAKKLPISQQQVLAGRGTIPFSAGQIQQQQQQAQQRQPRQDNLALDALRLANKLSQRPILAEAFPVGFFKEGTLEPPPKVPKGFKNLDVWNEHLLSEEANKYTEDELRSSTIQLLNNTLPENEKLASDAPYQQIKKMYLSINIDRRPKDLVKTFTLYQKKYTQKVEEVAARLMNENNEEFLKKGLIKLLNMKINGLSNFSLQDSTDADEVIQAFWTRYHDLLNSNLQNLNPQEEDSYVFKLKSYYEAYDAKIKERKNKN